VKFRWRNFLLQSGASVFIAFVIWLIAKQGDLETSWVLASVSVQNIPPNILVEASPREVYLNLQYPRELRNRVGSRSFGIPINAGELFPEDPQQWPGPSQPRSINYALSRSEIRKQMPTQIAQIIAIDPPSVVLTGKLITKVAPVEIRTTNSLSANLMLSGPLRAEPAQVTITGPPALLEHVKTVTTTAIDLSQVSGSMQSFPQLVLPEGVRLVGKPNAPLTVDIGVSERATHQVITDVPISLLSFYGLIARVSPATPKVVVEGPASVVANLSAADIGFTPSRDLPEVPGKIYEVGIEARLKASVPPEVASQITIRESQPSRIKVEFIAPAQQNTGGAAP
jgi:hypothetical protein